MTTTVIETAIRADTQQARRETRAFTRQFQSEFQRMAGVAQTSGQQIQQAAQRLGIRSYREINQEIRQLQNSYRIAASSSQLSARQQIQAKQRLQGQIRDLRREQSGYNDILQNARAGLLAFTAAAAGVGFALRNASQRARQFSQGIAEVSTLLPGTTSDLSSLREGVMEVSQSLGQDAVQSTEALYNIISAGVPQNNAIEVLRLSAQAAVAGVTDTNTAARAGLAVINAYGREITNLENVYDVLFSTVRGGVTTIPELAQNLGQVLPIAAAADVPFEELSAAIAELTKAGVRTPQATTALRGAITALQTPTDTAAGAMEELGIEFDGLFGTLQQISALNLSAQQIRDIVPEVEARTAVLALTQNIDALRESIQGMDNAAGQLVNAYAKMEGTPEQRIRIFKATVDNARISLGDFALRGIVPAADALAGLVQAIGELPPELRAVLGLTGAVVAAQLAWALGLRRLFQALRLAAAGAVTLTSVLRALPLLALGAQLLQLVAIFVQHRTAMKQMENAYEEFRKRQQEIIAANREYADTQILTREQFEQLTLDEQQEYQKRLQAARKYQKARRDLLSREADRLERSGESGDVAQGIAEDAAREERQYREALQGIGAVIEDREQLEAEHARTMREIKAEENDNIRRQLGEQIELYKDAQEELRELTDQREEIEQEFRELVDRIRSGGGGRDEDLDFIDIASIQTEARQALRAGDFERAIDLARRAGEGLEQLQEAGDSNTLALAGVAEQIRQIANEAARTREEAQRAEVESIQETIDTLAGRAEQLRNLEIGFDEVGAEENAEALKARIQQRLDENPIRIPVQVTDEEGKRLKAADDLLKRVRGSEESEDGTDQVSTQIDASFDQEAIQQDANAMLQQLQDQIADRPVQIPVQISGAGDIPDISNGAFASGGMLKGPGTDTSDSFLIAASNNEYVLRASAVKRLMSQYGRGFLDQLNATGRIPGFASGGLISQIPVPSLSREAVATASGSSETPLLLQLPDGQQFETRTDNNTARQLRRHLGLAALQSGKGNV